MTSYTYDWTWTVEFDGITLIEQDVRVEANWTLMAKNTPALLSITDVKALKSFTHPRQTVYLPEPYKTECMKALEKDTDFIDTWASSIADDMQQSAEDAIGDAQRESRED